MFQTIEKGLQEYRRLLGEYKKFREPNEVPSFHSREIWTRSLACARQVLGVTDEESRSLNAELGIPDIWVTIEV